MGVEIGYSIAFMAGIMGAWHCFGMCGGYAAGYFAGHGWSGSITPHLLYHGVRIASYTLMGVVGALLGQVLVQTGLFGKGQGILFIIAGILIVIIGISLTGSLSRRTTGQQQQGDMAPPRVRFDDWPRGRIYMPLAAGLVNGLVPCTLVFSIAIKAVATGDPLRSGLLMLCFGIGTLPAMLLATAAGALVGEKARGLFARLTGITVILFGAWTFYEGIVFYDIMRGLAN
jgi:sulfite exporter TauE/SafE